MDFLGRVDLDVLPFKVYLSSGGDTFYDLSTNLEGLTLSILYLLIYDNSTILSYGRVKIRKGNRILPLFLRMSGELSEMG